MATFFEAIEKRRSYYAISKDSVASDERIKEIVEHAVKHVPSAFNSQSARVIILLGKEHDKFWDLTTEALKAVVGDGDFSGTQQKMDGFKAGYGTVLFFEDQEPILKLQESFPLYAENFPIWSEQSSGMHQFAVWTGLENEGFGASLQHYNPIVDELVIKEWNVPETWKLRAQMPFGKPVQEPGEKEFLPLENRVKLYK
ncbi:nitroreductase family protein [Shouchella clausii]|uniref:nitroreductase family protein n=1 Tax=Shouchella clausii TaxID=79880 RepID=UPI000B96BF0C|nr:nitroreductase family protein [Shouchella clausii]AST94894.1 nitroreductase [Shouchella clausii]MCM3550821.1 nitroreductase family protein [Shouchella clausii]MCR1288833.1 nitroreductase family protein [Shouchella clausii]MCY1106323.1 nitroreductase family protein [Shouchella clausii]MEB5473334.1 nitroreductase family protein [Shouchella clausii]